MHKQDRRSSSISPGQNRCGDPSQPLAPTEDDIRAYAFHLYQQNGCKPGQDLENWLEAAACLSANIPPQESNTRLHQYLYKTENAGLDSHAPSPVAFTS